MTSDTSNITFIGFGEAAQAFAQGWRQDGVAVTLTGFDTKTDGPDAEAKLADYARFDVHGAATCVDACANAHAVFSFVTAEQAETAAQAAAQNGLNGALYFDCNSCAPNTKRRAAQVIEAAGGRYVDMAVMTPVHPRLHKSPCLMASTYTTSAREMVAHLGMLVEGAGAQVGDASTRKMIRSVMIKGLEALTLECMLAARTAGIETDILASLEQSFPGFDWQRRAPYMMERMATHGIRRAAEMDEVAQTLRDLGLDPLMTERTVTRQRDVGALALNVSAQDATDLGALSDMISARLAQTTPPKTEE